MQSEPKLLTEPEVAELLSVTIYAVRKWRLQGKIRYIKLGSAVRFHPDDVTEFIEGNRCINPVQAS